MQATLEAKFVAAQDGRGDWFAKIRPPTPTQASARDAVLARGGTPRANASFETLKETLDQMCEDIVRSDEPEVRFRSTLAMSGPYAVKDTHKTLIFLTFIEHTTVHMKGGEVTKRISVIRVFFEMLQNFY